MKTTKGDWGMGFKSYLALVALGGAALAAVPAKAKVIDQSDIGRVKRLLRVK